MTDNEAISEFLNNLSVLKGYSDNTIDSYRVDLLEFDKKNPAVYLVYSLFLHQK